MWHAVHSVGLLARRFNYTNVRAKHVNYIEHKLISNSVKHTGSVSCLFFIGAFGGY